MVDGRVTVSFTDTMQIYEKYGFFNRQDGSQSSIGISWRLTQVIDQDTPWRKKNGDYIKNMKKDQVQILFEGLDKVSWKTNFANCITKGAVGVLPNGNYPAALTACVTKDKNFT